MSQPPSNGRKPASVVYSWLVGVIAAAGTVAGLLGAISPARQWLVLVYARHSQPALVGVSIAALVLAAACLMLVAVLRSKVEPSNASGGMLLDAGPPVEFIKEIDTAVRVDIMFTTGQRFLQTHKRSLVSMVANNGHLRVLVARPRSQFLKDVQEMESSPARTRADLSPEVRGALQTLQEIRETTQSGLIEFGTFTTHLRTSLVIINQRRAWLGITLPPFRTTETPGILATKDGRPDDLVGMAVQHVERAWSVIPAAHKVEVK